MPGFIPHELTDFIQAYVSKPDMLYCLNKALTITQDSFYAHLWKPRCIEFAKFETKKGISSSDKMRPPRSDTAPIQQTITTVPFPDSTTLRWKKWISLSLSSGSDWMKFTHIH